MSIRYTSLFHVLTVLLALSAVVYSCKEPVKEEPVLPPSITIKTQSVDGEAGSQFVSVFASGNWTISSSASWLTVSPSSGSGNNNMVVISYGENTDAVRTASVTITSSGGSASASLTQNKIIVPDPVVDDRGYGSKTATVKWLEIPETRENDDKEFFTHYMTIGETQTRNYSFYWDYDNLVAPWVAYPLCAWNIGNGSRSDEWGIDHLLPHSSQPVLINGSYRGGWSRGHQIPSADRVVNRLANIQTFYGTNMTPQNYNFNGGIWANLENKVRAWARKTGATAGTDTLYVVTGCFVGSNPDKTYDNEYHGYVLLEELDKKRIYIDHNSSAVSIPQYYFKALLRYKNNESVGHKGFMGCAFWFENADKYGSKITKDMSMSLSKLEEKLGYKLFVNLESKVGAETYKEIKDEEPSTVSWWWN